jgi:hypothetical protein
MTVINFITKYRVLLAVIAIMALGSGLWEAIEAQVWISVILFSILIFLIIGSLILPLFRKRK